MTELAWHRPVSLIDTIVIHCSDTPDGFDVSIHDIDAWHAENGWRRAYEARQRHCPDLFACGYHLLIGVNGNATPGRALDEIGAHADRKSAMNIAPWYQGNWSSLGICMVGRSRFSIAQWATLKKTVSEWCTVLPHAKDGIRIIGHRQVNSQKSCPGFDVPSWLAGGMTEALENIYIKSVKG